MPPLSLHSVLSLWVYSHVIQCYTVHDTVMRWSKFLYLQNTSWPHTSEFISQSKTIKGKPELTESSQRIGGRKLRESIKFLRAPSSILRGDNLTLSLNVSHSSEINVIMVTDYELFGANCRIYNDIPVIILGARVLPLMIFKSLP